MKNIRISSLVYEMLLVAAKKHKPSPLKPEDFLEEIIEDAYRKIKKSRMVGVHPPLPPEVEKLRPIINHS